MEENKTENSSRSAKQAKTVDLNAYSAIMKEVLDESPSHSRTVSNDPPSSDNSIKPLRTRSEESSGKYPIFKETWFKAVQALTVVSVAVSAYFWVPSSRELTPQKAEEQLQAKYGENYEALRPLSNLADKNVNFGGASDPKFKLLVSDMNRSMDRLTGEEDLDAHLSPDNFLFNGNQVIYMSRRETAR